MNSITDWWQQLLRALSGRVGEPPPPPPPANREPATPDVLEGPPMVGQDTLRDWMIHHHIRNADVWQSVVAEFYNRVKRDDEIVQAYFLGVNLEGLQLHFMRALVVVTHIGLTERMANTLAEKHARLHITGEHFDRVVGVLLNVLTDYGVPRVAIPQLGNIAATLRRRIVTA